MAYSLASSARRECVQTKKKTMIHMALHHAETTYRFLPPVRRLAEYSGLVESAVFRRELLQFI